MKKQQVLLIHGGTTFEDMGRYLASLKAKTPNLEWILSRKDWKNTLQDQLGEEYAVYLPQMPNKQNAQYDEWKMLFEKIIALMDEGYYFSRLFAWGHFSRKVPFRKYNREESKEGASAWDALRQ